MPVRHPVIQRFRKTRIWRITLINSSNSTPAIMSAIVSDAVDKTLKSLHLRDVPTPAPLAGQVRVRVHAASLNPVDWKLADGTAPWLNAPQILGLDGAGVIDQLGDSVEGWAVGDRVAWHGNLREQGVFAEYALVPSHVLARVPESVSFQSAAALPCAGMTAYQALVRKAHLQPGQTVLVQGANGAVGGFAVQIAKAAGATVIALARTSQAERVRGLGADYVFERNDPELKEKVQALTGGYGVDVFLELSNPQDARKSLDLIRYNGQLLCIDPMPDLSRVPPYTYAASIHEVALGGAYSSGHRPTQEDFATMLNALLVMVAEGKLNPMVETMITLDQVPGHLAELREGHLPGKTVVKVRED
jgi:NADPH:quinone reductase-like Zn-dependent oxidoreductase